MTTTTDYGATWTDTGEMARVTDVTSAAPDTPDELILTAERALKLEQQNTVLRDHMAEVVGRMSELTAENEQLRAELDVLRSQFPALDRPAQQHGWTPGPDSMPARRRQDVRSAADLTEAQRTAALVAPTEDYLTATDGYGMPLTPHLAVTTRDSWPTWLGDVHHADAVWQQTVTDLRSWADQYAARPIERTIVEPVEVDTSYQQTDAALYAEMVVGQAQQSVYAELAPERIAGPPHHTDRPDPAEQERQTDDPPPQDPPPPADRTGVENLARRDKERRQREQRAIAPAPEPEPVRTSWRTWAASIALGLTPALGLLAFAWWVA